jgi:hypothetical protein
MRGTTGNISPSALSLTAEVCPGPCAECRTIRKEMFDRVEATVVVACRGCRPSDAAPLDPPLQSAVPGAGGGDLRLRPCCWDRVAATRSRSEGSGVEQAVGVVDAPDALDALPIGCAGGVSGVLEGVVEAGEVHVHTAGAVRSQGWPGDAGPADCAVVERGVHPGRVDAQVEPGRRCRRRRGALWRLQGADHGQGRGGGRPGD